jgi:hypothetical protein
MKAKKATSSLDELQSGWLNDAVYLTSFSHYLNYRRSFVYDGFGRDTNKAYELLFRV